MHYGKRIDRPALFSTRFQFVEDEFAHLKRKRWIVFNAETPQQIAALKHLKPTIYQTFAPSVTDLQAAGYDVVQSVQSDFDVAVVLLPKAKALSRHLIATAQKCTHSGLVIVDGQKDAGIDPILKDLRKRTSVGDAVSKAHGKIAWFAGDTDLSDYFDTPKSLADGFKTVAGVFSADAADPASELLLSVLPRLTGNVADLGAGWGYLTRNLIEMPTKGVIAVEADYRAIEIARVNVSSDKVKFVWADATSWCADEALDTVVMNPPFHNFGKADPGIGIDFIKTAVRSLKPQGDCYIVANRHLPYEQTLNELFQSVSEVTKDNRFKVLYASTPKRRAGI
jgi:16S rRNA (guanine1207-N2)-methyltransferase